MRLFKAEFIGEDGDDAAHYEGTKHDIHQWVKDSVPKSEWPSTKILELEMKTDKAGILAALNGEFEPDVIATFGLTKRGGLEPWQE